MIVLDFSYLGSTRFWNVPDGVTSIIVECWGAEGADAVAGNKSPGKGAYIKGTLSVTPGETLRLYIGGQPSGRLGGWNGGGDGGEGTDGDGSGGGGATDIRQGGSSLANRVAVAAGGGGPGFDITSNPGTGDGGDGGHATGEDGGDSSGGIFPGGTYAGSGGSGGTISAGGAGGDGTGISGQDGFIGGGGDGGSQPGSPSAGGGGGGGGYYGGGGGAAGNRETQDWYGAGGGGGSNYTTNLAPATSSRGLRSGNGFIRISHSAPPTATPVVSIEGGEYVEKNNIIVESYTSTLNSTDYVEGWFTDIAIYPESVYTAGGFSAGQTEGNVYYNSAFSSITAPSVDSLNPDEWSLTNPVDFDDFESDVVYRAYLRYGKYVEYPDTSTETVYSDWSYAEFTVVVHAANLVAPLGNASAVYVGSNLASRIYLGYNEVWSN